MPGLWLSRKLVQVAPALLLVLFSSLVSAQNSDADPWPVLYNTNNSIGPDGPWWYISQAVDFPDQILSVYPSLSRTSLIMSKNVCTSQTADCPLPVQSGWSPSGAYANVNNGSDTQSDPFSPADWDNNATALLGLDGYAFYTLQRMTIYRNGNAGSPAFLDGLAILVSNNLTVTFPGGAAYTVDVGLFTLSGSQDRVSWTSTNGTTSRGNINLLTAYNGDHIPSQSFGLHIGSVEPEIEGSLVLGGYDSSRCISEPIISDTTSFNLVDISLNVSRGASAFLNTTKNEVGGLLQVNGSPESTLEVRPEPGLPYLYLPRDTCDAIAAHLPVSYNADFNLYLWDTESPAYAQIVSSPHTLAFSFASGSTGETGIINVPFALLNLTLDSPLTSRPTPYFPCSPWTASSEVPYHLGRAFLQAAFLSYNSNTNKHFLAQAPGPDLLSKNVKRIGSTDSTISPAVNAPNWDSTWASTLKALSASSVATPDSGNGDGNGNGNNNGSNTQESSSNGLTGGAIAGIVIGVILIILAAAGGFWFFVFRKRRTQTPGYGTPAWEQKGTPPNTLEMPTAAQAQQPYDPSPAKGYYGYNQNQPHGHATEMPAEQPVPELESDSRSRAVELSTER